MPTSCSAHDPIPAWIHQHHGWRRRVQHLTPSWFSITMGTGVVSVLLAIQPYTAEWLRLLSTIVFVLNIVLFIAIFVASCLRYILYPEIWWMMLRHPVQSLFLGTCPMGLSTIINMVVLVCVPAWGEWAKTLAVSLWIVDVVLSVLCSMLLPIFM